MTPTIANPPVLPLQLPFTSGLEGPPSGTSPGRPGAAAASGPLPPRAGGSGGGTSTAPRQPLQALRPQGQAFTGTLAGAMPSPHHVIDIDRPDSPRGCSQAHLTTGLAAGFTSLMTFVFARSAPTPQVELGLYVASALSAATAAAAAGACVGKVWVEGRPRGDSA